MTPLAAQRRTAILEQVQAQGAVRVSELVRALGVSDMTVRRDLEALARRGLLTKVHGGATAVRPHTTDEPGFLAKSTQHEREKELIAQRAARLVLRPPRLVVRPPRLVVRPPLVRPGERHAHLAGVLALAHLSRRPLIVRSSAHAPLRT